MVMMKPDLKKSNPKSSNSALNLLVAQWTITWHHCDPDLKTFLTDLVGHFPSSLILYAIELSKQRNVSATLAPTLIKWLLVRWQAHGVKTVVAARQAFRHRQLEIRPWNLEMRHRILNSPRKKRWINNVTRRFRIPPAFRKSN